MTGDSINGFDFISSLPNAILHHILSFIPTKFAIRTSVLSNRWEHVWSETPSLSIDCRRINPNSIKETLTRYKAPKITSFNFCMNDEVITTSQIDSWIELAISRNAENLSLVVKSDYRFQDFFYISSSVKQISIESGTFGGGSTTVFWSALRNLYLSSCKLLSDESFAKILSGSPLLESLTLRHCVDLEHLDLSKSLQLKRLDIENSGPLEIVAPHIHRLRLTHSQLHCGLVEVSCSLTEAYLNIDCSSNIYLFLDKDLESLRGDLLQVMLLKMLERLKHVEKLTFGASFLQILSLADLCGVPFPTLEVKDLTLETTIVPSVIPGIAKLLQGSSELKMVNLHIMMDYNLVPDWCLNNYLNTKGLDSDQCWKPKDLVYPSSSESKLVTSFMKFLQENVGGGTDYMVGSLT